jgi:hypothetical protein
MAITRTVTSGRESESGSSLGAIADLVDGYGLVLFIVGAYVIEQIALANRFVTADSWLALLSGRGISEHGLPHVDQWTVIAHGRAWVDQQWLAQVALYRLQVVGGLRLVVLLGLGVALSSFAAAVVLAVRNGATPRALTWVVLASLAPYGRSADNLRAQSLCYPLFLAVVWLVTRRRTRSSFLVFPLLVLWANLHGSVVVGALLVSGCTLLRRRETAWQWTLAFVVGPWLCLFASPYAFDLPRYYRTLLVNPAFGHYVSEWKPMTLSLLDVPTYAIIAAILILLGTGRTGWSTEERFIVLACSAMSLLAVRNAVWLALAAIVFLAPAVSRVIAPFEGAAFARRMNRLLVSFAAAGIVVTGIATATRSADWYAASYPASAADVAASAARPNGHVFATEDFADWLIWQRPELGGRVAFDARLELLRAAELRSVFALEGTLRPDRELVRGYNVFVVPPALVPVIRDASSLQLHVLDRGHGVTVLGPWRG